MQAFYQINFISYISIFDSHGTLKSTSSQIHESLYARDRFLDPQVPKFMPRTKDPSVRMLWQIFDHTLLHSFIHLHIHSTFIRVSFWHKDLQGLFSNSTDVVTTCTNSMKLPMDYHELSLSLSESPPFDSVPP